MAKLEKRDEESAWNFYRSIQGNNDASAIRGHLWEWQVHKYFHSIMEPMTFQASSLDNSMESIEISFSHTIQHKDFGNIQTFQGLLMSLVHEHQSCYLKPSSKTFATVDSVLYVHDDNPNHQKLIGCQITDARAHPSSIKGFTIMQTSLKHTVPELECLRPSAGQKWIIVFIVPKPMGSSFTKQGYKEAVGRSIWDSKIAQYVLELDTKEVWKV